MPYGAYDGPDKQNKGKQGGACNRQLCQDEPANWWNRGSLSWYCAGCAHTLNTDPFNKRDAERLYGGPLCIEVSSPKQPLPDHLAWQDDVTPEGIALLRARSDAFRAEKAGGYTSDRVFDGIRTLAPEAAERSRDRAMRSKDRRSTPSAGNVFADLGLADPEAELAAADEKIMAGVPPRARIVVVDRGPLSMAAEEALMRGLRTELVVMDEAQDVGPVRYDWLKDDGVRQQLRINHREARRLKREAQKGRLRKGRYRK
jgi:hypothetical protein